MPTEESKKEPSLAQKKLLALAEIRRNTLHNAIKQLEQTPPDESSPTTLTDWFKKLPKQLTNTGDKVQLLWATRQKLQDMKQELNITDISVKPAKRSSVDENLIPENATLQQLQMLYLIEETKNIGLFEKCSEELERLLRIREDNVCIALQELKKYHLDPHYYDNKAFESKEKNLSNLQIPISPKSELDELPMRNVHNRVRRIDDHIQKYERLLEPLKDMPSLLLRIDEAFAERLQALEKHEKEASEKLAVYDIMIEKQIEFEKKLQRYTVRKALLHHYFGENDKDSGVFEDYLKAQHGRHKTLDTLSDYNPRNLFTSRLPRQGRRNEYIQSLRQAMQDYVNDESQRDKLLELIKEGLTKKSQQNPLKKKKDPEERPLYKLLKGFEEDIKEHTVPQGKEEKEEEILKRSP